MTLTAVFDCLPTLKKLSKAKTIKEQRMILDECGKNCIYHVISEISHNILLGNIPLNRKEKMRLHRYKAELRSLNKKRMSLNLRKKIIQKGKGFLPTLLFPAISILSSLIREK